MYAQTKKKIAYCNIYNKASRIRRSSYTRKLSTLAVAGYKMILLLKICRYKYSNPDCIKKLFSQQVKYIALRYGRRSQSLNNSLFKQTHRIIDLINSLNESDIIAWLSQNSTINICNQGPCNFLC